jgi:hypothetical protein
MHLSPTPNQVRNKQPLGLREQIQDSPPPHLLTFEFAKKPKELRRKQERKLIYA